MRTPGSLVILAISLVVSSCALSVSSEGSQLAAGPAEESLTEYEGLVPCTVDVNLVRPDGAVPTREVFRTWIDVAGADAAIAVAFAPGGSPDTWLVRSFPDGTAGPDAFDGASDVRAVRLVEDGAGAPVAEMTLVTRDRSGRPAARIAVRISAWEAHRSGTMRAWCTAAESIAQFDL